MKKSWICLALIAMLTICLLPALGEDIELPDLAEEAEPSPVGDWFTDLEGITLQITLNEDGTYTTTVLGEVSEPGEWAMEDGDIYLDGDKSSPLFFIDGKLVSPDDGMVFTQEAPEQFVPAPLMENSFPLFFEGHWTCLYLEVEEMLIPADWLNEDTELWIEREDDTAEQIGEDEVSITFGDALVVTRGQIFGETVQRFVWEENVYVLRLQDGSGTITLAMLEDGMMKLSLETEVETLNLYLARVTVEDEEADE